MEDGCLLTTGGNDELGRLASVYFETGFRPCGRALVYCVLKGATVSWRLPKGATVVVSAKGPNKKVSLFETNQTISALQDAPCKVTP